MLGKSQDANEKIIGLFLSLILPFHQIQIYLVMKSQLRIHLK